MTRTAWVRRLLAEAAGEELDVAAHMLLPWLADHPTRIDRVARLLWAMHRADRRRKREASRHGAPIPITLVISPSLRATSPARAAP